MSSCDEEDTVEVGLVLVFFLHLGGGDLTSSFSSLDVSCRVGGGTGKLVVFAEPDLVFWMTWAGGGSAGPLLRPECLLMLCISQFMWSLNFSLHGSQ